MWIYVHREFFTIFGQRINVLNYKYRYFLEQLKCKIEISIQLPHPQQTEHIAKWYLSCLNPAVLFDEYEERIFCL